MMNNYLWRCAPLADARQHKWKRLQPRPQRCHSPHLPCASHPRCPGRTQHSGVPQATQYCSIAHCCSYVGLRYLQQGRRVHLRCLSQLTQLIICARPWHQIQAIPDMLRCSGVECLHAILANHRSCSLICLATVGSAVHEHNWLGRSGALAFVQHGVLSRIWLQHHGYHNKTQLP